MCLLVVKCYGVIVTIQQVVEIKQLWVFSAVSIVHMQACRDDLNLGLRINPNPLFDHNFGSRNFHSLEALKIFVVVIGLGFSTVFLEHLHFPHEARQFPARIPTSHRSKMLMAVQ